MVLHIKRQANVKAVVFKPPGSLMEQLRGEGGGRSKPTQPAPIFDDFCEPLWEIMNIFYCFKKPSEIQMYSISFKTRR